jgi:hypothetical protein
MGIRRLPAVAALTAAAFVSACGGSGHDRSSTQTTTGAGGSTATASSPAHRHCFAHPSACGYPDRSNTGVPASFRGRLVVREGDLVVHTPGAVVSGMEIHGSIEITADNVRVENSEVISAGATAHNIWIGPNVGGVVIQDSTLRGRDTAANAVQYGVQNAGLSTNTGLRLQMFNCTECWSGSGTVRDSYAITNAVVAGAHYEPVYFGGGGGRLTVDHNTLLNPHDQTAAVFTKADFGPLGPVTITNNLLAGGGFLIYGGGGGNAAVVGPVTVTGNRFARCLSPPIADRGGGHYCRGGPDANGYWPEGGHYGVGGAFVARATTWSGNYWDADGAPATSG